MEGLINWLETLDWGVICAAIWTFIVAHISSIILLIIGWLKAKSKNANFQEQLEILKKQQEDLLQQTINDLKKSLIDSVNGMKENIINNNKESYQKMVDDVHEAIETAKNDVSSLNPINNSFNIKNALKELE